MFHQNFQSHSVVNATGIEPGGFPKTSFTIIVMENIKVVSARDGVKKKKKKHIV